jgi:hypothetical protein
MSNVLIKMLKFAAFAVAAGLMILVILITNSTVALTSGGVYKHIYIPVGLGSIKLNATGRLQADMPRLTSFQGPIIMYEEEGYSVNGYCQDKIVEQIVHDETITLQCGAKESHFHLHESSPIQSAIFENVSKIAVTSDLEGNLDYFEQWLQHTKVTDDEGNWTFDNGHVVVLGDAVDRGRQVYDLLWRLYHLDQEAKLHDGKVWLVIGNHEQYVMFGVTDRVETEHLWATEELMPYKRAFSSDSVLGQWIRHQPIMLNLNDFLFVHGGISPEVMAMQLSVDDVNSIHYNSLKSDQQNRLAETVLYGKNSLTQYRGLLSEDQGQQQENTALLESIHAFYGTKYLVIGHTPVESILVDEARGLIAIETDGNDEQALVIAQNSLSLKPVPMKKLDYSDENMVMRDFQVSKASDWLALVPDSEFLRGIERAKQSMKGADSPVIQ